MTIGLFLVKVNKNSVAIAQKETMTSGSVNVYPVKFDFSGSEWDGLTRLALFKSGEKVIQYILDETNTVQMPWELMETSGNKIYVGVCGHNGDEIVLPTSWASCGSVIEGVHSAHGSGSDPEPPPSGLSLEKLADELLAIQESLPDPMDAQTLRDILTGGD